jgi:hypothetical protein
MMNGVGLEMKIRMAGLGLLRLTRFAALELALMLSGFYIVRVSRLVKLTYGQPTKRADSDTCSLGSKTSVKGIVETDDRLPPTHCPLPSLCCDSMGVHR